MIIDFILSIYSQEDEIRDLAKEIWRKNGCPDGRSDEFWFKAERIVKNRLKIAPPSDFSPKILLRKN